MKHILKQAIILLMLGNVAELCEAKSYANPMDMKGNQVTLIGRLSRTGSNGVNSVPANPAPQPVTVEQNPANLVITFLSSLGNLNIMVINEQGYPVYQKTVNAVNGANHTINSQSWNTGTYTILIADFLGGILSGEFRIP